MKDKVLVLGAGMVVQPLVDYLLNNDMGVTLASRTKSKADKVIGSHPNGKAIGWTVDDNQTLENLILEHDLVVSLLPYQHHVTVARLCIEHHTNMLTTSYISDEMKALDSSAKKADIIILNEIGVDPGFDHMTAMRIIDRVHEKGGKIDIFYSLCGALAAPEALDNPLNYKFSWSPKGVVMAGNNDAKFLEGGRVVHKMTEDLFKDPLRIDFPEIGEMEVYPNRDSLHYIDIYGIPEVSTIYRGTFRYKNWCEAMHILKKMGLTGYQKYDLNSKSYKQFLVEVTGIEDQKDLAASISKKYEISKNAPAIEALDYLGFFDDRQIQLTQGSPFDVLSDLMIEKMMLKPGDRDMVIMQHIFEVINKDGSKEKIISSLLDFGDDQYTSIAKTVAYPAAIGAKMILEGKINLKGVHIPIRKEIYEPILSELGLLGIKMDEQFGLPV